jgi:hypothetical protein
MCRASFFRPGLTIGEFGKDLLLHPDLHLNLSDPSRIIPRAVASNLFPQGTGEGDEELSTSWKEDDDVS